MGPTLSHRCNVLLWGTTLALLGASQWLQAQDAASLSPAPEHGRGSALLKAPEQASDPDLSGDPLQFSPDELRELQRRFGVHGPQPRLAQLFTQGMDQLQPLRSVTMGRLEELSPVILQESRRVGINPMLVAAVLFDELQHSKPGESLPIAAHSGLFSTLGPAQIGLGEMVHQGLLSPDASASELQQARQYLLDPHRNVQLLVGKFARLSKSLGLPRHRLLMASTSRRDAKSLGALAYLHNGKLDYPRRVFRYMQDPELHALVYGTRKRALAPLI